MNCPKCGADNIDSRLYCSVCGASLTKGSPQDSPTKRRSFPSRTILWIAAVFAINLFGCGLSYSLTRAGLLLLLINTDLAAIPAALWIRRINRYQVGNVWLYRMVFIGLSFFTWPILLCLLIVPDLEKRWTNPIKAVAVLTAASVPLFLLCVGSARLYGGYQDRQHKAELSQLQAVAEQRQREMAANLDTLAQTWGPNVTLCESDQYPTASYVTVPASAPRKFLFIDPRFPDVTYWHDQLPSDERASGPEEVTWLVCLTPRIADQKCEYDRGVKLSYQTLSFELHLFYLGDQVLHVAKEEIWGTAQDTCPDRIVYPANDASYYVMADNSQRPMGDLHLDQTVTFDQVYEVVNWIIRQRMRE